MLTQTPDGDDDCNQIRLSDSTCSDFILSDETIKESVAKPNYANVQYEPKIKELATPSVDHIDVQTPHPDDIDKSDLNTLSDSNLIVKGIF